MPPLPNCERCGGPKRGRGQGYCIDAECRKAAKEEKEQRKDGSKGGRPPKEDSRRARKQALQEEREEIDAGSRGPKPGEGSAGPGRPASEKSRRKKKEALQEEREEIGAGSRGPKPGEGSGGRPAIPEAARRGPPYVGEDEFDKEQVRRSYRHFLRGPSSAFQGFARLVAP